MVLVTALLQGDENPLRLAPHVSQVVQQSHRAHRNCCRSVWGALGRETRSVQTFPCADIHGGLRYSTFTALVLWIRLMHVHWFQELRAHSVLLVAALCHMDALRQLCMAEWHIVVV